MQFVWWHATDHPAGTSAPTPAEYSTSSRRSILSKLHDANEDEHDPEHQHAASPCIAVLQQSSRRPSCRPARSVDHSLGFSSSGPHFGASFGARVALVPSRQRRVGALDVARARRTISAEGMAWSRRSWSTSLRWLTFGLWAPASCGWPGSWRCAGLRGPGRATQRRRLDRLMRRCVVQLGPRRLVATSAP